MHLKIDHQLRTWDELDDSVQTSGSTPLVSEASVFTFDSFITTLVQCRHARSSAVDYHRHSRVNLPNLRSQEEYPPRSLDETLALLMRATLGNTTTGGIKWKAKEYRFEWTRSGGRVSGLAEDSTAS